MGLTSDPNDPRIKRGAPDTVTWVRHRFEANPEDYRSVTFPPPGPYWCTGYAGDGSYSIVVAYLPPRVDVREFWPEARNIESELCDEIVFTDRFPKPDWWNASAAEPGR